MKNTALFILISIIVTQLIMMSIFAQSIVYLFNFTDFFWSGLWEFNAFGRYCLIIACATLGLAIYFIYQKATYASYSLGIIAGIFWGILFYMINIMALY